MYRWTFLKLGNDIVKFHGIYINASVWIKAIGFWRKTLQRRQGVSIKSVNSKNSIACGWIIYKSWPPTSGMCRISCLWLVSLIHQCKCFFFSRQQDHLFVHDHYAKWCLFSKPSKKYSYNTEYGKCFWVHQELYASNLLLTYIILNWYLYSIFKLVYKHGSQLWSIQIVAFNLTMLLSNFTNICLYCSSESWWFSWLDAIYVTHCNVPVCILSWLPSVFVISCFTPQVDKASFSGSWSVVFLGR